MFQVRFYGRGGQGVVTAAELLSLAAFADGHHAQTFPSFGSERTGAPVVSFCRIDDAPIRTCEPITELDALVVQDVTLIHQVDLFSGLGEEGYVLFNTSRDITSLGLGDLYRRISPARLATCPGTELARLLLGCPLPNAALLGGFAALTGVVSLNALEEALREHFAGAAGERNVTAAAAAYRMVALTPVGRDLPDAPAD